jgi:tetratricopeptide (TPR) repeat protein
MSVLKTKRFSLYLIFILLTGCTFFAYWQVDKFDFVSFDDHQYVSKNPHVMSGFNKKNLFWAFTTFEAANWHPLTWLSHTLDCQLYGEKPAGHHLTNLMLHIANTLLLFFILRVMTGSMWKSALVAALFGLHPLHVESVAWVSERKDLLSTFFMFLSLLCYSSFAIRKKQAFYFGAVFLFAIGLLAKPMIVTLPFVLLLLDFWPLQRFSVLPENILEARGASFKKKLLLLCAEKTPFFILTIASCVVTVLAQHAGQAIVKTNELSLLPRIENSVISYVNYIGKMFWPTHLSFFYPHPVRLPSFWILSLACVLLAGITLFALLNVKKRPYVLVGWLWYIGTLIPVIGIVQVGSQAMADRYTYFPLIGLFIIISWLLYDLTYRNRFLKITAIAFSLVILFIISITARIQAGYWKNDLALADHGIAVTKDNFLAYSIKGNYMLSLDRYSDALYCLQKSISLRPSQTAPRLNVGLIYLRQKKPREAIAVLSELLAQDSNYTLANLNCGNAYGMIGDPKSAIQCFRRAIAADPNFTAALHNLGVTYGTIKDYPNCRQYLLEAVRTNLNDAESYFWLGKCCYNDNNINEAILWYKKSIALVSDFPDSHRKLGEAYKSCGRPDLAKMQFSIADSLALCQGTREKQF